jgi:ATP-dependent helicase HrpA
MWQGTRRLLLLNVPSPVKPLLPRLTGRAKLTLSRYPYGRAADLFADCVACAADALLADAGGPAWDRAGFARLHEAVRAGLPDAVLDVVTSVERILAVVYDVDERLRALANPALAAALADARRQLSGLVYPGFVAATGRRRLPDVLRYVRAIRLRLEKLPNDPYRDEGLMLRVLELQDAYRQIQDRLPASQALEEVRWMLEELRVSYFAQTLGTPHPVSEQRIRRAMDRLPA